MIDMKMRHFLAFLFASHCGMAEYKITGQVVDQHARPVAGIKVQDVWGSGLSTTTGPDGWYSIQGSKGVLDHVMLVALADFTCDSSSFVPKYFSINPGTNRADIVVVRKPAKKGTVKLVIPWVLQHASEYNLAHSNLVVELQASMGPEKQLFQSTAADGLLVTNVVFGKEYILAVDVPPLDYTVITEMRGVFYEGDVGSTNSFRLLDECIYRATNILYSIESIQETDCAP